MNKRRRFKAKRRRTERKRRARCIDLFFDLSIMNLSNLKVYYPNLIWSKHEMNG